MAITKKKPPVKKTRKLPTPRKIQQAVDQAAEQIERARVQAAESKQPRFAIDTKQINDFFNKIYGFTKDAIFSEPKYQADSRKRDAWLAKAVTKEPYLLGILQSVVSIDKNRGWTLIGGRNQVRKFVAVLHNFQVSADISGWRNGMSVTAQSYYQSDLGSVVEIGRSIPNGPLAALYTVDPAQCQLTGNLEKPLRYVPAKKEDQAWSVNDYFRVPSFPSTNEKLFGLGFCAISRCLDLAKLVVSLYEHEREKLGSKAPKGILTINGVTQQQWLQSLEESNDERSVLEREYYSGVQVLANGDNGPDIKVELTSLSSLPEDFDRRAYVDMVIYGYALAFGYDPREFWPVSSGGLSTATESESQHRRATSKGGLDFALGFQEKIQEELPPTIDFEFEKRDVAGDLAEAELQKAQLDIIAQLYSGSNAVQGGPNAAPLVNFEEARQLLVTAKLIPEDWTPQEEDQQISDTDDAGAEELLEKQRVRHAMERFPDQEIVIYNDRTQKTRVIYDPNKKKFAMPNIKPKQRAGEDYSSIRSSFYDAVYDSVHDYLDSSDRSTSFKSAMKRNIVDSYTPAVEAGYTFAGAELPLEGDVNDFLTAAQGVELANVDSLFVSLAELRKQDDLDAEAEATRRAEGYANSLDGLYNKAVLYGLENKMLTFDGDDGAESCASCQSLKGQRHKASWWIAHDYVPPNGGGLDCGAGGHCEHELVDDDGNVWTE